MNQLWIASMLVLWVVVLVMGFLLLGALREIGLLHLRLGADPGALITRDGLDHGAPAPDFVARDLAGAPVRLADLPSRSTLLVFLSTSCFNCRELVPHLNEIARTRAEFSYLTICRGDGKACRELVASTNLRTPTVVDEDGMIERDYAVPMTPFAYLLDERRHVVIRGVANNWRHLESLLEQEGTPEPEQGFAAVDGRDPSGTSRSG